MSFIAGSTPELCLTSVQLAENLSVTKYNLKEISTLKCVILCVIAQVSQRTHKCEANGPMDDANAGDKRDDIVRNRSVWLERLVTAQQQLLSNQVIANPLALDESMNPDEPVPGPSASVQQHEPFDPIKSFYDTDSLPTLDLSQLTLSLDSELIFPS